MFLKEFTEKKNESAYNSVLNNIKMAESFCIKLKFVVAIFTSLIHNPLNAIVRTQRPYNHSCFIAPTNVGNSTGSPDSSCRECY